jgi:hypothetical protein
MTDALLLAIMALSLAGIYLLLKKGFTTPAAPPSNRPAGASYVPAPPGEPVEHWSDSGRLQTEVVAESRYNSTVQKLAGAHGESGADTRLQAVLTVDQNNPYDDKPVAVFIAGEMVGYLSPKDAQAFRALQARKEISDRAISCDAAIRGGADWEGKRLAYAIWLDIEPTR